ncbi:MAG: toll/interleukin-1 receptor domain-containing protein, partial [Nitrososphaera sp.]|nr:toll/interleukin-1 receptor domain-containing protein [Nitrososphaera sp.]
MGDYKYDVFFSYKRDPHTDEWHEIVKAKIEYWLKQELKRLSIEVFFDREEISTGDFWEQKISEALKHSRCMIGIWSPLYFQSKWCMSELKSFIKREQKLCLGVKRLIVPARFHDGELFPPIAKQYQAKDFRPYASTMPFFWNTEAAWKFEQLELKAFAKDLAETIKICPDYEDDFPIEKATDQDVMEEP